MSANFSCILCNSHSNPLIVQHKVKGDRDEVLKVVRCQNCGHLQLDPPNYSIDYYNQDEQVKFVVHDYGTPLEKILEHSWIDAKRRLARFEEKGISLEKISSCNGNLRILDIGGGYGFFGSTIKSKYPDADVIVLEPSATRAKMGEKYLLESDYGHSVPKFLTDFLEEDFVTNHKQTFDVVTMWHVLEHVPNPINLLHLALQLVKSGSGIVCVEVPNANDELMKLSPAFRDRNYMVEHISYFTPQSLEMTARKAKIDAKIKIYGYQRYGIFNYFHWIHFNQPQGANPDLFKEKDL